MPETLEAHADTMMARVGSVGNLRTRVLILLSEQQHQTPSVPEMALALGCSRRGVQKALASLVASRLVQVTRRPGLRSTYRVFL